MSFTPPNCAVGAEGEAIRAQYAAVRTPIVSLSFADDEMMSAANTESIHGFYSGAHRALRILQDRLRGLALAAALAARARLKDFSSVL
jgi:predicted alpha/beta hydrolase